MSTRDGGKIAKRRGGRRRRRRRRRGSIRRRRIRRGLCFRGCMYWRLSGVVVGQRHKVRTGARQKCLQRHTDLLCTSGFFVQSRRVIDNASKIGPKQESLAFCGRLTSASGVVWERRPRSSHTPATAATAIPGISNYVITYPYRQKIFPRKPPPTFASTSSTTTHRISSPPPPVHL